MSRKTILRWMVIASLCLMVLSFCGCDSFDALANTVLAVLGGIGVVLASVGTLLTPAESAAVQEGVQIAESGVTALKKAVDAYEEDKTGTGLLAAVQAAVAALQQNLAGLLAAAQIKNTTLQAWITKVVGLVGTVLQEVVTDILPELAPAMQAHLAGDNTKLESLSDRIKALTKQFRADHDAALDASGLPADAIKAAHKHVNDKLAHHIGPIKV